MFSRNKSKYLHFVSLTLDLYLFSEVGSTAIFGHSLYYALYLVIYKEVNFKVHVKTYTYT